MLTSTHQPGVTDNHTTSAVVRGTASISWATSRLRLVLDALPDEPLMLTLEAERRAATTTRCVPYGTP